MLLCVVAVLLLCVVALCSFVLGGAMLGRCWGGAGSVSVLGRCCVGAQL